MGPKYLAKIGLNWTFFQGFEPVAQPQNTVKFCNGHVFDIYIIGDNIIEYWPWGRSPTTPNPENVRFCLSYRAKALSTPACGSACGFAYGIAF